MNYCFLVIAPSGTGKDTVVNTLCEKYGYTKVKSYTTRPPRNKDVNDKDNHIFITEEQYHELPNKVATTFFDDNYYCATAEQVDNADFYIVDVEGVRTIKENYKGDKQLKVIGLTIDDKTRKERMKHRGDSTRSIKSRIENDKKMFKDFSSCVDVVFVNSDLDKCVKDIKQYIESMQI